MQPRALMLLGPTACGKTALSLKLAREFPVEIISVDSALIYRGMDIGSAKPSIAERAVCPHHLIDEREISEPYSAADFQSDASRLIEEIRSRGNVPLLVGGTMLYAKALREGIDQLPSTDESVRERVLREAERIGRPAMHEKLATFDPVIAERLKPNDAQRIARAFEVFEMTGQPLSGFQTGEKRPDPSILTIGLVPRDRARLHEKIALRLEIMLKAGFLEEVEALIQREDFDEDLPAMRSVGYRQAVEYLKGIVDYATFVEKAKAATRQLAKRQMTWLRSMAQVTLHDPDATTPETLFCSLSDEVRRMAG